MSILPSTNPGGGPYTDIQQRPDSFLHKHSCLVNVAKASKKFKYSGLHISYLCSTHAILAWSGPFASSLFQQISPCSWQAQQLFVLLCRH